MMVLAILDYGLNRIIVMAEHQGALHKCRNIDCFAGLIFILFSDLLMGRRVDLSNAQSVNLLVGNGDSVRMLKYKGLIPALLLFGMCLIVLGQDSFANGSPSSSRSGTSIANPDPRYHSKGRSNGQGPAVVNQVGSGNTYMIVDSANNRIKVIVEGKEVAYFHKGGLHVDGAVTSSTPPVEGGRR